LVFGAEARQNLHLGINTLAHAVGVTLGPRGGAVALQRRYPHIIVTRDGATVAREIKLADPYLDMGVRILKEAATRTKDAAGDGTTTTAVLALSIVNEGLKMIAAGVNPMLLRRGIEKATVATVRAIRGQSIEVKGQEDMAIVAGTCVNDMQIGQFIGQVLEQVTHEGVVTVEESPGRELEVEYVEGYQFDRGYISPHFITASQTREAVVRNPRILITSQRISSADDLMPVLRRLAAADKREIVIVAEEVRGDALTILVVNKNQGRLKCLAVKSPEFGEQRLSTLEDLAIVTGGRLVAAERGDAFRNTTIHDMGQASKVIATHDHTTIINPGGSPEAIQDRIQQIRREIRQAANLYEMHRLEKRLARLMGRAAVIRVGAPTRLALREKKHQLQDAVAVAKAAMVEGIVPGGGVAFMNASAALKNVPGEFDDEAMGVAIMQRALQEPLRRIAENSGQNGAVVVETVRRLQKEQANPYLGYDALRDEYGDMLVKGIVDTARMACIAVENAASVASMLLTVEGLVTPIEAKGLDGPEARS
jgi:chaperonin GroEL